MQIYSRIYVVMALLWFSMIVGSVAYGYELHSHWADWKGHNGEWCLRSTSKSLCLPPGYSVVEFSADHAVFHPADEEYWRKVIEFHADFSDENEREYFPNGQYRAISKHAGHGVTIVAYMMPGSDTEHPDIYAHVIRFDEGFAMLVHGLDDVEMAEIAESLSRQWTAKTK